MSLNYDRLRVDCAAAFVRSNSAELAGMGHDCCLDAMGT